MRKNLLAILCSICFAPAFSQNTYNGTLTADAPTFNRPEPGLPPTALSGSVVPYNELTLEIKSAGVITVVSNSTWDNFMVLYDSNGLVPATPLVNAIIANDDFTGPNAGFSYNFPAAGSYHLVICSFKPNVTGTYSIVVTPAVVLPVKLLSFTAANASTNSNVLKWSGADENNLSAYQVQRSTDAKNFSDLADGNIKAKNNAGNAMYDFTDNHPAAGYNYYRLEIIERSGKISYGPVALVKNGKAIFVDVNVFPNPASDYLQIGIKAMQNNKALVSIINAGGETLQSKQYTFNNQSVLSVDIKTFPAGKYFLRTVVNNKQSTVMFIKK